MLLDELAERCEKATGPDRELDFELALVAGCTQIGYRVYRGEDGKYLGSARYYTKSIDAAVTLVPAGHYWHLGHGRTRDDEPLGGAAIIAPDGLHTLAEAEAPTAALALCAAALRARAIAEVAEKVRA